MIEMLNEGFFRKLIAVISEKFSFNKRQDCVLYN